MIAARTTGEAGLWLMLQGYDITGGAYRLHGSQLTWTVPTSKGPRQFSFALTHPNADGFGPGRSTILDASSLTRWIGGKLQQLLPPDRRYVSAFLDAMRADVANVKAVAEQARLLGADGLERVETWLGELDAAYVEALQSAPRPRPIEAIPGAFGHDGIPDTPFPLDAISHWLLMDFEGEVAWAQHPQGAVVEVHVVDEVVRKATVHTGADAIRLFLAKGADLTPRQWEHLGMELRPRRPLQQALGAIGGRADLLDVIAAPGGRRVRFWSLSMLMGVMRQATLVTLTDTDGALLGHRVLQGADGYEQTILLIERAARVEGVLEQLTGAARDILRTFRDPDGQERRTALLRPRPEDYAKVFTANADAIRARYEAAWDSDGPKIEPPPDYAELSVVACPAGRLDTPEADALGFPEGLGSLVSILNPDVPWLLWRYDGLRYEGLCWLGDHWAWFPKPWRFMPKG